ncbi:MAG: AmmeMemoRadiSam system protein B [Candidatus Aenigmatarchaeota archaeon]
MRLSNFNGYFYPFLKEEIEKFIKENEKEINEIDEEILLAIVPHAGWNYSGKCALHVYKNLRKVENVIIIATNHSSIGKVILSLEDIKTPLGLIKINKEFIKKILDKIDFSEIDENIHENEHSIEVQLPFLQYYLKKFKLVPILVSNLDRDEIELFTNFLIENIDFKNSVIIFSGDMIHHGKIYNFEIFKTNKKENVKNADIEIINSILEKNIEKFRELAKKYYTVCGYYSFQIFIEISKKLNLNNKLLCYYNSADITNDEDIIVGYSSIISYHPNFTTL